MWVTWSVTFLWLRLLKLWSKEYFSTSAVIVWKVIINSLVWLGERALNLSRTVSPNVANIIHSLHEGMKATGWLAVGGETNDNFQVTSDLRKGYILASTLFVLFSPLLCAMPPRAYHLMMASASDTEQIATSSTSGAYALSWSKLRQSAISCTQWCWLWHKQNSCKSVQILINRLKSACKQWGLTISKEKTEVLHQQSGVPTATLPPLFLRPWVLVRPESNLRPPAWQPDDQPTEPLCQVPHFLLAWVMLRFVYFRGLIYILDEKKMFSFRNH